MVTVNGWDLVNYGMIFFMDEHINAKKVDGALLGCVREWISGKRDLHMEKDLQRNYPKEKT